MIQGILSKSYGMYEVDTHTATMPDRDDYSPYATGQLLYEQACNYYEKSLNNRKLYKVVCDNEEWLKENEGKVIIAVIQTENEVVCSNGLCTCGSNLHQKLFCCFAVTRNRTIAIPKIN